MPSVTRLSIGAALMLLLVTTSMAAAHPPAMAPATPQPEAGDFAGLVDIGGGRSLYLACRGTGSPTVILEAGYRSPATVWTDDLLSPQSPRQTVLPALAAETRVCAYERPGVAAVLDDRLQPSRSDPVPMPRTAESVVADLHALLEASGEPGPYVLVGHSLGGLMVRLYAATYPEDVAGLVLVDAWSESLEHLLTPDQWAAYVALNSATPPALAGYPDLETIDFAAASASMRQSAGETPLRPMPLFVLSKGQPFGMSAAELGFDPAVLEAAWDAAQLELAALLPDARHIQVEASGHYIQIERPEVVIDAVRQVLQEVPDAVSQAERDMRASVHGTPGLTAVGTSAPLRAWHRDCIEAPKSTARGNRFER